MTAEDGQAAFAAGRMAVAVEELEQALDDDSSRRLDLLPVLASALARTGDLARAEALLDEAATAARQARDRGAELRAVLEQASWRLQTDASSEGQARKLAEAAFVELQSLGDELGVAKALHLLADVQDTWVATTELLERALVHASRSGDHREQADIVWWLGVSFHHGPTPVVSGIARCEELLGEVGHDRTVEAGMLGMLAGLNAMQGRFDEARELFARGLAILEELGIRLRVATRRTISGEIELLAGDPVAAERELRWGYGRLVEMGEQGDLPAIAGQLAEALYRQGRYDDARHFAAESERVFAGAGTGGIRFRGVRAKLLARRGELDLGVTLAREAVALAERDDRPNVQGDSLLDLAETLELAGRLDAATAAARKAARMFELKGNDVSAEVARRKLGPG